MDDLFSSCMHALIYQGHTGCSVCIGPCIFKETILTLAQSIYLVYTGWIFCAKSIIIRGASLIYEPNKQQMSNKCYLTLRTKH